MRPTRGDQAVALGFDIGGGVSRASTHKRCVRGWRAPLFVSFISQFHTLQPGDVISLGTAFKPGAGRKSIHQANFQTVAGPVEVAIEGLGTQENPVVIEQKELGAWRLP